MCWLHTVLVGNQNLKQRQFLLEVIGAMCKVELSHPDCGVSKRVSCCQASKRLQETLQALVSVSIPSSYVLLSFGN